MISSHLIHNTYLDISLFLKNDGEMVRGGRVVDKVGHEGQVVDLLLHRDAAGLEPGAPRYLPGKGAHELFKTHCKSLLKKVIFSICICSREN